MASLTVVPAIATPVAQLPATATVPTPAPPARPRSLETLERANLDACREYQAYYDEALCRRVGMQVPQAKPGQDVNDYRCETLRTFKRAFLPQNHPLYKVQYRRLRDDPVTLRNFEPQLLSSCVTEAYNPNNVPKGELRKVEELDGYGKAHMIRFVGQESFVKLPNFGTDIRATGGYRPGRRVKSFTTERGKVVYTDRKGHILT